MDLELDSFINVPLIKEPMNWGIVFVVASLFLLLYHTIMQGWTALMSPQQQGAFGGPGQVAAPIPDVTAMFSALGNLAGNGGPPNDTSSNFYGNGASSWTDGIEARYGEDGWTGNA